MKHTMLQCSKDTGGWVRVTESAPTQYLSLLQHYDQM